MHSLLCFLNILPLGNSVLLTQILPNFNINLLWLCVQVFEFLEKIRLAQQLLITFYLYSSVRYPRRFRALQRKRVIFYFIAGMVAILVLANVPYLFYELRSTNELILKDNKSERVCYSSVEICSIVTVLNVFFRYIAPLVGMFFLNFSIINYLSDCKKLFISRKRNQKSKNFIISMVVINFLFFFLYFPWFLFYNIILISNFVDNINIFIDYSNILVLYLFNVALTITYINYTIPFFIHFVFNNLFRLELILVFKDLCNFFRFNQGDNLKNSSFLNTRNSWFFKCCSWFFKC